LNLGALEKITGSKLHVPERRRPYNLQNGNLIDLTYENDDICMWAVLVMVAIFAGNLQHIFLCINLPGNYCYE